MVGIDECLVWVPYEVWSPSRKGMDNSEKFFIVDVPVSLRGIESLGKESNRVELAFLIPLLKDGANSVSGGVTINRELVLKPGLSQNGGGPNSIYQGVECGFKLIVPVKLPSLGAMSNKCIERCGQHAKIVNIHAIEIQEAEECSNFLQSRESFPVLHTSDFDWVHGNGIFSDNNTEIFHFGLLELTFLRFEVEIIDCEDAQDIVHDTAM